MAVFGAPVAFEDAPLRACRAALSILQLRTPDLSSKQNTASGPWRIGNFQKLFPEILARTCTHKSGSMSA
jgi:hypothetical protein